MVWKIEEEYNEIVKDKQWMLVFYRIGQASNTQNLFSITEAKKLGNKHLNRYSDVSPYDHTRVKLSRIDKDYINANFVNVPNANRKYILTQGPLLITTGHFWLMIWEQKSQGILMLNKLIEKTESKCHQYWPKNMDSTTIFENVSLAVTLISECNENYYIVRKFKLLDLVSNETREIVQFHYTTWPDFGVPTSPKQFLDFLKIVRSSGVLEPNIGPPIVHCSAGIGRSGTFCLVDSTLVIMERDGVDSVDIKDVLIEIRKQRMGLIQTPDQLKFSYQAVIEGIKRFDPDYNGEPMEENLSPTAISIQETMTNDDPSPSPPPLPPRGESLDRIMDFLPLPPIPKDSSLDDNLSSESEASEEDLFQIMNRQVDNAAIKNYVEQRTAKFKYDSSSGQDSPAHVTSRKFNSKPQGSETSGSPKKKKWNCRSIIPLTLTLSLGIIFTGILFLYFKRS